MFTSFFLFAPSEPASTTTQMRVPNNQSHDFARDRVRTRSMNRSSHCEFSNHQAHLRQHIFQLVIKRDTAGVSGSVLHFSTVVVCALLLLQLQNKTNQPCSLSTVTRQALYANRHLPQDNRNTSKPLGDCAPSSKEKMPKYAWWSGYQMTLEDFIAFVGSIPGLDVDPDRGKDEFHSHYFAFCRWKRHLPARVKRYAPPVRCEHSDRPSPTMTTMPCCF